MHLVHVNEVVRGHREPGGERPPVAQDRGQVVADVTPEVEAVIRWRADARGA
jgi:hypothetical protein